jgi:hypothetical protein
MKTSGLSEPWRSITFWTPTLFGIESSGSLRKRLGRLHIITDDNMGQEWSRNIQSPWH